MLHLSISRVRTSLYPRRPSPPSASPAGSACDTHGNLLCRHNRRQYYCVSCGGAGICEHGKQRRACPSCKTAKAANASTPPGRLQRRCPATPPTVSKLKMPGAPAACLNPQPPFSLHSFAARGSLAAQGLSGCAPLRAALSPEQRAAVLQAAQAEILRVTLTARTRLH